MAAEELAREKFACPACGAEAIWNPAKQALVCPFCGTTSPAKLDAATGGIVEHDLVTALRGITDDKRGWQTEKRYVKCQSCQAISVLDPQRQAQRCDFCGSAQLVPYEQTKDAFRPESLLPFKVTEDKARDGIRAWYGRLWLAPNKLKRTALTDTVKGIYLPYWTFDAKVDARMDGGGRVTTITRRNRIPTAAGDRRRGRCSTCAGRARQGSSSISSTTISSARRWACMRRCCAGSSRFRPASSKPTTRVMWRAGSSSDIRSTWSLPRRRRATIWMRKLRQMCAAQIPGDTYRNLDVRANYSGQTFKHILAPVWLLSYHFGTKAFQAVMNGFTGTVAGEYPRAGSRSPCSSSPSSSFWSLRSRSAAIAEAHVTQENRMKTAIVTGVSRGLGEALARTLLARGFAVTGIGRTSGAALTAPNYRFVVCDLADTINIDARADAGLSRHCRCAARVPVSDQQRRDRGARRHDRLARRSSVGSIDGGKPGCTYRRRQSVLPHVRRSGAGATHHQCLIRRGGFTASRRRALFDRRRRGSRC